MKGTSGQTGDFSNTHQPKTARSKTASRIVIILVLLVLLAYYVYVAMGHEPTVLRELTTTYSFSDLVAKAISTFGEATLFAFLTGFIALAAFFTSIPSSGGFASSSPRVAGLFLIEAMLTWAVGIFILVGLLVLPSVLASTALLYVPLVIAALFANPANTSDPTFGELEETTQGAVVSVLEVLLMRRMRWPTALLIVILGEVVYFANNNPSYPLIAWFLLIYALFGAFLILAQSYGTAYLTMTAKLAQVTETDGTKIEGYVISKGSDHYLVQTKERLFLLQSSFVREIEIVKRTKKTILFSRRKSDASEV